MHPQIDAGRRHTLINILLEFHTFILLLFDDGIIITLSNYTIKNCFILGHIWTKKDCPEEALNYYIKLAEIRKEQLGLDNEATKDSVRQSLRVAKLFGKVAELPNWINEND